MMNVAMVGNFSVGGTLGSGQLAAAAVGLRLSIKPVTGANRYCRDSIIEISADRVHSAPPGETVERLFRLFEQAYCMLALPGTGVPRPEGWSVDGIAITAALALELQRKLGYGVTDFGQLDDPESTGRPGWWFQCTDIFVGEAALRTARDIIGSMTLTQSEAELTEEIGAQIESLIKQDVDRYPSLNGWTVGRAARNMGLPRWHLMARTPIWVFGVGAKSVRHFSGVFEQESFISNRLQHGKQITSPILARAGISVPEQRTVDSYAEAKAAAAEIGYPVVVKPPMGMLARRVVVNIRSSAELKAAVRQNDLRGGEFVVERYVEGDLFRLIIVHGEVVTVSRRDRPEVVGDGRSSIAELVEQYNAADPRRGKAVRLALKPIVLPAPGSPVRTPFGDDGMTPESIPENGQRVTLSYFGSITTADRPPTVTNSVHPGYFQVARRIYAHIPIPHCAIDLICKDITTPPDPGSYAVNEINSFPGMYWTHLDGSHGQSAMKIVRAVVGEPEDLHVPVVAIVTDRAVPSLAPAVAAALSENGSSVTIAGRDGYTSGSLKLSGAPHDTLEGMQRAIEDRQSEAIVIERVYDELAERGFGLDRADLVIFAPSASGDVNRFLERTQFMRAIGRRGCVLVDFVPTDAWAAAGDVTRDTLVWSRAELPPAEAKNWVADVFSPGREQNEIKILHTHDETSRGIAARPVTGDQPNSVDRLISAAVLDRLTPR